MLHRAQRPLSHQEMASHPESRGLDRVTLYRTLTALQRAGLLHRVQGVDGVWRFGGPRPDPGTCGGNHLHFLCLQCEQMSCLTGQPLPWVQGPPGAAIFGKQLLVYGRCAACSRTQPAASPPARPKRRAESNARPAAPTPRRRRRRGPAPGGR